MNHDQVMNLNLDELKELLALDLISEHKDFEATSILARFYVRAVIELAKEEVRKSCNHAWRGAGGGSGGKLKQSSSVCSECSLSLYYLDLMTVPHE